MGNGRFDDQDVLVPWKMQAKYADPSYTERLQAAANGQELPAPPTHGAAESGEWIRVYCHGVLYSDDLVLVFYDNRASGPPGL